MSLLVVCPNASCRKAWTATGAHAPTSCPYCGAHLHDSVADGADLASGKPSLDPDYTPLPDVTPLVIANIGNTPCVTAGYVPAPNTEPSLAAPDPRARGFPPRLGRFLLKRFLAEGAFGRVFEAYDPQLDRLIAVKIVKGDVNDDAERVRRFLREARAAANLRHPNIVPVFDAGQDVGCFFIASAIISGETLADRLKREKMPLRQAATIAWQVAEALAYAHDHGVVHRDVKPGNVLIDETGQALLTDFGVAFRRDEERLTREGALIGTPQYMAPEQARGQSGEAMPATDQYSLGVMLYELLTGQPPFVGAMDLVLYHHLQTQPVPPRVLAPGLDQDLDFACMRCLEKDPARRFRDCQELAGFLRGWLDKLPASQVRSHDSIRPPVPVEATRRILRRSTSPMLRFLLQESVIWKLALASTLFVAGLAVAALVR